MHGLCPMQVVRSNVNGPNIVLKLFEKFVELAELNAEVHVKEFGLLEKPLVDYTGEISIFMAKAKEAELTSPNEVDDGIIRIMTEKFKDSFIDKAKYVCTLLKEQVPFLLDLQTFNQIQASEQVSTVST